MRRLLGIIAVVGALVAPRPAAAQSVRYKVIVNATNPASVLMASELARIYLGTANVWPDRKTLVQAIDQADGSPLHEAFVREILDKDSTSLSHYWEQAIFSGNALPPRKLASEMEIVDFVRRNPGAIAYVSANTTLAPETKVLRIVR